MYKLSKCYQGIRQWKAGKSTAGGNAHPDDITCLAVDVYLAYAGCRNVIRAFDNGRQVSLVIL